MSHRTALPSSKKTHSEKHKQILKQLLKESANKTCSDCKTAKSPRWASWNLGCFICIRCSGIHRSMGTHISKVKSVDLDAWTDEQVELMIKWGNEKANWYWESKLPENYVPNDLKIENFIRTKYEMKKWAASGAIPDPLSINLGTGSSSRPIPQQESNSNDLLGGFSPKRSTAPASTSPRTLLDDDFGLFTSSSSPSQAHSRSAPIPPTRGVPTTGARVSSPQAQSQTPVARVKSPQAQSAQSTGGSISSINNGRPDLKKSILSLYSSPSSSSSFIQPQQQQQQHQQTYRNNTGSVNTLANSMNGLNFSQNTTNTSTASVNGSAVGSPVSNGTSLNYGLNTTNNNGFVSSSSSLKQQSWNNEWNDTSSSSGAAAPASNNRSALNIGLDDDLFKNVWN